MKLSRRNFIGGIGAVGAGFLLPGCCSMCGCGARPRIGLQLYSIRKYIQEVGLARALADVRAIGYTGVEFAGYYDNDARALKKLLDDNGLVACGTHVGKDSFSPENYRATCEFNLGYGNDFICCPGGGNMPPKVDWGTGMDGKVVTMTAEQEDYLKQLCDYYNTAAANCAKYGCRIGLHNHTWEFKLVMRDGTTFWDYFFSHTDAAVQMEQDVGWTTCAGYDPCEQYLKYPNRSVTLHAKENGMGKGVREFDAILGRPGKPGATPVDWDRLQPVATADGVKWYVVECERHENDLSAVKPSYEFLRSKGLS